MDAAALADNLGLEMLTIPIEEGHQAMLNMLSGSFQGTESGVAEENLQARLRGNMLMALSNKFGWLVLITGNKSEMAMGYATLYGDMAGGFAVLKDVPKTLVYELSRWRNENGTPQERHPPGDHRQAPQRGAAARPERRRFAASLRHPGRRPAGLRGGGQKLPGDSVAGLRPRHGAAGDGRRRPERVQATSVPAGRKDNRQRPSAKTAASP